MMIVLTAAGAGATKASLTDICHLAQSLPHRRSRLDFLSH